MILEALHALDEERLENGDRLVCVLRPVLATREVKKNEDWRHNNIC